MNLTNMLQCAIIALLLIIVVGGAYAFQKVPEIVEEKVNQKVDPVLENMASISANANETFLQVDHMAIQLDGLDKGFRELKEWARNFTETSSSFRGFDVGRLENLLVRAEDLTSNPMFGAMGQESNPLIFVMKMLSKLFGEGEKTIASALTSPAV